MPTCGINKRARRTKKRTPSLSAVATAEALEKVAVEVMDKQPRKGLTDKFEEMKKKREVAKSKARRL